MLEVLEKPTTGDDAADIFDSEYFFFIDRSIVGWTNADCWVCAWKDGYRQWSNSRMAVTIKESSEAPWRTTQCRQTRELVNWVFYEDQVVLLRTLADCWVCGMKTGFTQHPQSKVALEVTTEPSDVHLECRGSKRKREKGQG